MRNKFSLLRWASGKLHATTFSVLALSGVLALGVIDAQAAGGRAAGGKMAKSSVAGANRTAGNVGNTGSRNNVGNNSGNNRGNNVNIGNDINVDIDHGYNNWHHHDYHPIATAAVIGAVAVTTAAVVGSYYYALPPTGCTMVYRNGISYYYCGTVYYSKTWHGNDVVYVVVTP